MWIERKKRDANLLRGPCIVIATAALWVLTVIVIESILNYLHRMYT
jgi:hypothetical protein